MAMLGIFALLFVVSIQGSLSFELENVHSIRNFMPHIQGSKLPAGYEDEFRSSIVGGRNATRGEIPHHAVLFMDYPGGRSMCGASIIARKYLLTAAHCVYGLEHKPENVSAYVGIHNITQLETAKRYVAKTIHIHCGYTGRPEDSFHDDITVIELEDAITYTRYVKRIKINTIHTPVMGSSCRSSGFGRVDGRNYDTAETLKTALVKVVNHEECRYFHQTLNLTAGQLCMHAFRSSPCNGDSGGSLVCTIDYEKYLTGVTSFVLLPTCIPTPHVQTNVVEYADWIHEKCNCVY